MTKLLSIGLDNSSRLLKYAAVIAVVALVSVFLLLAQLPSGQYRFVDLGALPGDIYSVAFDINDPGKIVGRSGPTEGPYHAVLWENDTITDLGALPGDDHSEARAINNRGQIVGFSTMSTSGPPHAVLWENGTITDLGTFDNASKSSATGINELGQIIGGGEIYENNPETHALLWDKGTITDLGKIGVWVSPIGGLGFSEAYGINNRGQIVGRSSTETGVHAVLWENGTITDLGTLPGDDYSEALGINERGQIMGLSGAWEATYPYHAVLWENGTITDLMIPITSYGGVSYGINNPGQIVFPSFLDIGYNRATLWDKGTITDLGALFTGSGASVAFGLNDRGQVVGGAVDTNGHATLWTR